MDQQRLSELYRDMAAHCRIAGVPNDELFNGGVHQWLRANVTHKPDNAFFIVLGICSAMADMTAQEEGYRDAIDRAATLMQERMEAKRRLALTGK